MISETTIQKVKDTAEIVEVVNALLPELKKKGVNYEACCPFHNENTPSFHVSPVRQIYKCFGCGIGGDAISFVKNHENLTYPEAIQWLAELYKIPVERDHTYTKEEWEKKLSREAEITGIMKLAENYYHKTLMTMPDESDVWQELQARGIDRQKAILWRLGYAPDNSKNITPTLINKGWISPAMDIGLLRQKSGMTYDFYRHRVMIPLHDTKGNILGFSGRRVGDDEQYPKYINPSESELYSKSDMLFGLYEAQHAIRHAGFAYQVEGNFDVISLHLSGVENTVAPCGTALTSEQAKRLRKYTDKVVIIGDGDKSGIKAMMKNIDLYLAFGFRTEVCVLPTGEDPDSFIRKQQKKPIAA